jgi:hypothetical protein
MGSGAESLITVKMICQAIFMHFASAQFHHAFDHKLLSLKNDAGSPRQKFLILALQRKERDVLMSQAARSLSVRTEGYRPCFVGSIQLPVVKDA